VLENLLRCPACHHGAGFHFDGGCLLIVGEPCPCELSTNAICGQVLLEDRLTRERELDQLQYSDAYLVAR
jgi:hypothetical protein